MSKYKKRNKGEAAKLEMTPMIDVVFQLLIFFIVTLKQHDILSKLDVSRPAPDTAPPPEQPEDLLTITVYKEGYVLKGGKVTLSELDRQLTSIAQYNKNVSVVIKCTGDSPHAFLVRLLDTCAKIGLKNMSVFSM